MQGGGGCRGGDGCQSAMVLEWSRSRSHHGLSLPVERCGQSGRRLGRGWVGEVEGKGMGEGRGGGAAYSVERSPLITEAYVGLLPLLVDIAFKQIHTHMTIYTNVKFPRTCGQLNGRTRAAFTSCMTIQPEG